MKTKPNSPAFSDTIGGLTKREYFAVQALAGLCANGNSNLSLTECAKYAVFTADALIKYLNEENV